MQVLSMMLFTIIRNYGQLVMKGLLCGMLISLNNNLFLLLCSKDKEKPNSSEIHHINNKKDKNRIDFKINKAVMERKVM